jgi:hypothetical protein
MTAKTEIRTLTADEMHAVAGGYISTIDVSGMPSRDVVCGTMWLWDRLLKTIFGKA